MPKNIGLVAGAAIIIVVLAALGFLMMNNSKSQNEAVAPIQNIQNQEMSTTSSLKSLLGVGKNVKCDIIYTDEKGKGTVYVSDKKFRGDFDVTVSGAPEVMTHMIQDGQYAYMWTEGSSQGTKFNVEDYESDTSASPAPQNQGADLNKDVNMKCSSWNVDSSIFTPPSGVQFQDMSTLMQKTQQGQQPQTGGSSAPKMDSSYCSQITDEAAKAACVKAASGN